MTTVNQEAEMSTSIPTSATSTETTREIVQYKEMAHKIDRLSLLPNELLDHIFDLAYSIFTPTTGPISKHLLPFHINGIYRRIYLSKADNIRKLFNRIESSPDLGEMILDLHLYGRPGCQTTTFDVVEIDQFFGRLVRLEWLDLNSDSHGLLDTILSTMPSSNFPRLRHITTSASSDSGQHPLLELAAFPALQALSINNYSILDELHDTINSRQLPLLTHLSISGLSADDLSVASFCNLCPSLTQLTLECIAPTYFNLLKTLPTNLLRLELQCSDDQPDKLCEQHLSRFSHLRHLVLGDGMFTSDLPSHLIGLRALEALEIGEGRISTTEMLELFDKVPITRLKLDLTTGETGYRLQVDEKGLAGGRWVPGEGRLVAGDWVVPKFDVGQGEEFTLEGTREMIRTAGEMGIEVEGSISKAIEVMDAYYLEIANLAIHRCFRDKTFDHYLDVQKQNLDARLPPLDLDSLDPTRLKIRKMELEEEGWFVLTLEN